MFIRAFFSPAFQYTFPGKKDRSVTNGLTDVNNSRNGSKILFCGLTDVWFDLLCELGGEHVCVYMHVHMYV